MNQFTILATVPQNANLSKEYDPPFRIVKRCEANGPTGQPVNRPESHLVFLPIF